MKYSVFPMKQYQYGKTTAFSFQGLTLGLKIFNCLNSRLCKLPSPRAYSPTRWRHPPPPPVLAGHACQPGRVSAHGSRARESPKKVGKGTGGGRGQERENTVAGRRAEDVQENPWPSVSWPVGCCGVPWGAVGYHGVVRGLLRGGRG